MYNFGEITKKILHKSFLSQILIDLDVQNNKIKEPQIKSLLSLLQQANEKITKDIEIPNLIWNSNSRNELLSVLKEQTLFVPKQEESIFCKNLAEFKYNAHENELIIAGVFVRVINKDPYMRIENPFDFANAAIQKLNETKVEELSTNTALYNEASAVIECLNNIMVFQKGIGLGIFTPSNIQVLCKFIMFSITSVQKHMEHILCNIFSILQEGTKDPRQAMHLMETKDFTKVALISLCELKNDFLVTKFLVCFDDISLHRECDPQLISLGFLITLLKIAFDNKLCRLYRNMSFRICQKVLLFQKLDGKLKDIAFFIPIQLIERINEQSSLKPEEWIEKIDTDKLDIFLNWDQDLRTKVQELLNIEVKHILEAIIKEENIVWATNSNTPNIAQYTNTGEIVISGIILTRYIRCPYVKLKVSYIY